MDGFTYPDQGVAVFVYGSLLSESDLKKTFPNGRYYQATLNGYQRKLNVPSDRRTNKQKGVFNIEPNKEHSCNGVLVLGVQAREFGQYALRETGYQFERLSPNDITVSRSVYLPEEIITARSFDTSDDIPPLDSYLEKCVSYAGQWGDEFQQEFIKTSFTADGSQVKAPDHLSQK